MRTLTFNRIIGAGAMGTVYHADLTVRGSSRPCAVKVMKASTPDQEHFRARMRDEARLLELLRDEQILGVSELLKVEGHDCVLMEYVEGVDLAALLPEQKVPPKALAELGADLAGTIHRAHAATNPATGEPLRVIHRDVKPANVMLTRRGHVRLLDFGVARAAFENRETHTQGLVLGTLNYFPPEILAGAEPTPAVDLYGLGLTLWECAAGRDWGTPQVHRHRFERRVEQRLSELGSDYDPVVAVVRRLLQWRPEDRPTAKEVEKLLHAATDATSGMGLRTWARKVVPAALTRRDASAGSDELVGKTLAVEALPDPPRVQPIHDPIVRPARAAETQTFNDLAPPAAVLRGQGRTRPRGARAEAAPHQPPPPIDSGSIPELDLDPVTGEEPREEDLARTEPNPLPPKARAPAALGPASPASPGRPGPDDPGGIGAEAVTVVAAAASAAPSAAPSAAAPAAAAGDAPAAPPEGDAETILISAPGRLAALAAAASGRSAAAGAWASADPMYPAGATAAPGAGSGAHAGAAPNATTGWRSVASTLLMLVGAATFGGVVGAGMLLSVMVVGWLFAG